MEDKWTPDVLVWPWCMDRFTGTKGDKVCVTEALAERRFPIRNLRLKPPPAELQTVAGRILTRMLNAKDKGELPWLLALSNEPTILQAVANLIPVGYALSVLGSCAVTSTQQLVDLFYSRRPADSFEPDPDGESLHEVQVSGFLAWVDINSTVSGSVHQTGRFASLMEYRLKHKLLTLFTAPYMVWSAGTQAQIDDEIARATGQAVGSMLKQVPVINVKVKVAKRDLSTLEV